MYNVHSIIQSSVIEYSYMGSYSVRCSVIIQFSAVLKHEFLTVKYTYIHTIVISCLEQQNI